MAFREVTMLEVKEILRLWLTGVPKKEIAPQLSLDVKTVRRYLAAAKARGVEVAHGPATLDDELVARVLAATQSATGRPRGDGWTISETNREFIAQHLDHGVRLTKIGKLLRRRGVEISYDAFAASRSPSWGSGAPRPPCRSPTASQARRSRSTPGG
jgi:predicted ArsR family transcriptional regulator